jgi:hypothetical protein
MSDPTRWSEMTDAEIEGLIRRLPAKQPAAELRGRVLVRASRRVGRTAALRPAIALGALVVLLLLDSVVLAWQDRRMGGDIRMTGTVAPAVKPLPGDSLGDLDLAGAPYLPARLRVAAAERETYLQLRSRLLEKGEGG